MASGDFGQGDVEGEARDEDDDGGEADEGGIRRESGGGGEAAQESCSDGCEDDSKGGPTGAGGDLANGEEDDDGDDRRGDGVIEIGGNEDGEAAAGEEPRGDVDRERVVGRGLADGFELFEAVFKVDLSHFDIFDEAIDFPEASEVVIAGFDSLDVNELIELIVFPEGTGEGGGADEEVAVEPEHFGDVAEVTLDAFAGGSAFVQGAPELDDKAGALTEAGLFGRHVREF